ncbi:dihydroneopterin aldolase [Luteolibacter algae]|uniref:dihydroneopterin aldolase n=1 Tax=Luteolibacter algae TaxID=454151 RepID=A0ABW5D7P0_9BACT
MIADEIEIRRLQVLTHIGVPDEERATPQMLWLSIWMRPAKSFSEAADDVANTIDYYEVSLRLVELAAAKPRKLIETLATDSADFLLKTYPLKSVDVKVEKRILENADFVSVKITRQAAI